METKPCITCKRELGISEFWQDKKKKSGFFAECKNCNQARASAWYAKNYPSKRSEYVERVVKNRKNNPIAQLLRSAKARAKQRGIEFLITKDDLNWPETCPVFGFNLNYGGNGTKKPDHNSASLDRINNSLGYIKGNVAVISYRANTLKRDGSLDELRKIIEWMEGVC